MDIQEKIISLLRQCPSYIVSDLEKALPNEDVTSAIIALQIAGRIDHRISGLGTRYVVRDA